jgi:4-amino-4-deoxy-L-arabinose transferase-like glycosyltransferase
LIVGTHTFLLTWGVYRQSPTCDEIRHLAAGVSYWNLGHCTVYRLNPPLTRLVAALPVLAAHPKTDWKRFSKGGGWAVDLKVEEDFLQANGTRTLWLCRLARCGCIAFSWLGAWICYRWAKELYGDEAGYLALVLWCFCPNIIAHAQLITSDAGATAFGIAATYSFWRWLQTPGWLSTFVAGASLGLADLTKFTWLVLFLIFPALWVIWRMSDRRCRADLRAWIRQALQLAILMAFAVYIINLIYGFDGSFQPLGSFSFVSRTLTKAPAVDDRMMTEPEGNRFVGGWLQNVPVPLPRDFVLGCDHLNKELEVIRRPSYLRGEFRADGWWYYYIYAATIKVPVGSWLLFLLALGTPLLVTQRWPAWHNTTIVVVPAIVLVVLVSLQTGRMSNFRFALPVLPFLFIFASRSARLVELHSPWLNALSVAALTWSIASSVWIYPHSLSYFNEMAGGPHRGAAHLLGSNVDWGQDVLFLQDWISQHPDAKPLYLSYYGACDPKYIGLSTGCESIEGGRERVRVEALRSYWYGCSLNYIVWSSQGATKYNAGSLPRLSIPERPPDSKAGYSIWLWHINPNKN